MKMSNRFNLPMKVDGHSVESTPHIPNFATQEVISDIECDSGGDAEYVAHAINMHDELVDALEYIISVSELKSRGNDASVKKGINQIGEPMYYRLNLSSIHKAKEALEKAKS